MSTRSDPDGSELETVALDVWLGFLSQAALDDAPAFERLCRERPGLAGELRKLRSGERGARTELGPSASSETSFDERLRRLAQPFPGGTRFLREGVIARGGMGVVHRVRDVQLGRTLALKEMSAGAACLHTLAAARFYEEAQITAQLDHPGIVPVHECGVDSEGRLYFAMKLVQGEDLRTILTRARVGREEWSLPRLLGVLLKVCEAMAYAHSKGVIHRDLKPANIMVGHFGEVYVMDWGLARAIGRRDVHDLRLKPRPGTEDLRSLRRAEREETSDSPLVTMDGVIVGTPAFMSPEQARGEIQLLSPRSDVYSLGAVLYQVLTGVAPYAHAGERASPQVVASVIDGPPPSVRDLAPDVPPELVAIADKAMARDPARRYPDTITLRDDLRACLEGRVVRAHESGAIAELKKWIGRNQGFAATAAAAILALAGGLFTSLRFSVQAAGESARARAKAEEATQRTADVLRLSDLQELDDLTAEADGLWPIVPESAAALEQWLARAHRLRARLPVHEEKLASMSTNDETRWWRNLLVKLIAGTKALEDPATGLIAGTSPRHGWGIQKRLDFARSIREKSVEGPAAAELWRDALTSIGDAAECPQYRGLELTPQLGLLPIGRDPESGLWEFAHLATGEPAARDADGRLVLQHDTGLVLVLVPGGAFRMGAQKTEEAGDNFLPWAEAHEMPVRSVSLAPFFLSKYEMTQGQWLAFTGSNPSENAGDVLTGSHLPRDPMLLPVEMVSWSECTAVLERLGLMLPTEAEWEYAARAGTSTIWWSGNDDRSLEGKENLSDRNVYQRNSNEGFHYEEWLDDGVDLTSPVGGYDANPFGFHDVQGNVMEWCRDVSAEAGNLAHRPGDGLGTLPDGSPVPEHDARVIRGGSWQSLAIGAACARRRAWRSSNQDWDLGLRPARALVTR